MRVRDWQDIVADVVENDVEPDRWRAVGGGRARGIGEDVYLGHPDAGLYQLKTYAKNPFEVKGVGARLARKVDDDIGTYLPEKAAGRFAIHPGAEDKEDAEAKARRLGETVKAHADAPTTPDALFEDMMEAIESPAFGPIEFEGSDRPDPVSDLSTTFEDAEEVLETEFEDLIEEDEIGRGFL